MFHKVQILPETRWTSRENENFEMRFVSGQFHVLISVAVAQVDSHPRSKALSVQHLPEIVHFQILLKTARMGAQSDHTFQVSRLRKRIQ